MWLFCDPKSGGGECTATSRCERDAMMRGTLARILGRWISRRRGDTETDAEGFVIDGLCRGNIDRSKSDKSRSTNLPKTILGPRFSPCLRVSVTSKSKRIKPRQRAADQTGFGAASRT
jgi:hypothetical protein